MVLHLHIPDGYLDPIIALITYLITIMYGIFILRRGEALNEEKITEMTVIAAGIFVAQMLNWPIPGGTSLHFVGGALAAILYGLKGAFIIMFLVLLVQAVVFHDGGITTLGANVLNMGIIAPVVGYYIYKLITTKTNIKNKEFIGAFLGGWLSITLAGIACGIELGLSTQFIYGLSVSVPVMAIGHFLLGIVEGIITALVIRYLRRESDEHVS